MIEHGAGMLCFFWRCSCTRRTAQASCAALAGGPWLCVGSRRESRPRTEIRPSICATAGRTAVSCRAGLVAITRAVDKLVACQVPLMRACPPAPETQRYKRKRQIQLRVVHVPALRVTILAMSAGRVHCRVCGARGRVCSGCGARKLRLARAWIYRQKAPKN